MTMVFTQSTKQPFYTITRIPFELELLGEQMVFSVFNNMMKGKVWVFFTVSQLVMVFCERLDTLKDGTTKTGIHNKQNGVGKEFYKSNGQYTVLICTGHVFVV